MRMRWFSRRLIFPQHRYRSIAAGSGGAKVRRPRARALAGGNVAAGGVYSRFFRACEIQSLEARVFFSVDQFVDVNPTGGTASLAFVFDINGKVYFTADDGTHGLELWHSDGTVAGTAMVKDINPAGASTPLAFVNLNGELLFTADDGTHGRAVVEDRRHNRGHVDDRRHQPNRRIKPNVVDQYQRHDLFLRRRRIARQEIFLCQ